MKVLVGSTAVDVGVGVEVCVPVEVGVGVGVAVAVMVAVGVDVLVTVDVGVNVGTGVDVFTGGKIFVEVKAGVGVCAFDAVGATVWDGGWEAVGSTVRVGMKVAGKRGLGVMVKIGWESSTSRVARRSSGLPVAGESIISCLRIFPLIKGIE